MSVFQEARMIPLAAFLSRTMGVDEEHVGGNIRFSACPNCGGSSHNDIKLSVRGDFWRCFQCGETGDITKAASMLWGCGQKEAAEKLIYGERPVVEIKPATKETKADAGESVEAMARILPRLREACGIQKPGVQYLASRGIGEGVILEAAMQGQIGFLPCNPLEAFGLLKEAAGEDDLRLSGLWREGAKVPGCIYRPMVSFLGESSAEFRLIREPKPDERKSIRYGRATGPWRLSGDSSKGLIIAEGVIDMLSLRQLGFKGDIKATPGCNAWRTEWFADLKGRGNTRIGFDNDSKRNNPGQVWAAKLKESLESIGCMATIMAPPMGMDINDLLRAKTAS